MMDKVAMWQGIRFRVESAPGDCMTSNSRARDIFGRQYGFETVTLPSDLGVVGILKWGHGELPMLLLWTRVVILVRVKF